MWSTRGIGFHSDRFWNHGSQWKSSERIFNGCRSRDIDFVRNRCGWWIVDVCHTTYPPRERDIRRFCAILLRVSADPARVPPETSQSLAELTDIRDLSKDESRLKLIRQLIAARVKIAQAIDVERMETETDDLLELLRVAEASRAAGSSEELTL